jgi:pimeloyl-ACP methyl ester carboxylesterase
MFMFRVILFFLKIGMAFVPQDKYEAKLAQIKGPDEKNIGCDLQGWEYLTLTDTATGFVHRYYRFPSKKENAPVFLLFHGLNLDGRTFLNQKDLADEYELIAYDLPENTPRYKGQFTDFTDIVDEFIALKGIKACCVAGVSFGGSIALHLAANHPQIKIGRLVLISTGLVGDDKGSKKQNKSMATWVEKQPDYKLYWMMERLFQNAKSDTSGGIDKILRVKHPDFYRQVGKSMGTYNAVEDAKKLTCPVLWLLGDKDNLFSANQQDRILATVPQAEFKVIKDGTHSMVFTRAPEINALIEDFCHRHPLEP